MHSATQPKPSGEKAKIALPGALRRAGVAPSDGSTVNVAKARDVLDLMRVDKEHRLTSHAVLKTAIQGDAGAHHTKDDIHGWMDDFLSFLPPEKGKQLDPFTLKLEKLAADGDPRKQGLWQPDENTLTLFMEAVEMHSPGVAKRTLFHEMTHWLEELSGKAADDWRASVQEHYSERTAGLDDEDGYIEDGFPEKYAGKLGGGELSATMLEYLADEFDFLYAARKNSRLFFETLSIITRILT